MVCCSVATAQAFDGWRHLAYGGRSNTVASLPGNQLTRARII